MKESIIIIFFVGLLYSARCLDQEHIAAIDAYIQNEFLPLHHVPGLGLGIVHGSSSLAKGYGYRDLENSSLATANTFFSIGSVSKSFTALVVIRALHAAFPTLGEAVLDVPIRTLIPSYNFTLIDRFRSENANFRDLLSHRLCNHPGSWEVLTYASQDKDEFIYRQRYGEAVCSPRTEFVYNNAHVQLAGEVAAAIANTTFEQLLMNLFNDIGMTQTTFIRDSDDLEGFSLLARPYYRVDGMPRRFNMELLKRTSVAPGSGGILSTPNEFIHFIKLHLNHGRVGSVQVIPEWIGTISNRIPAINFKTNGSEQFHDTGIGYALGHTIGSFDGYMRIGHSGYLTPYSSHWTNVPEIGIGVFTTMNGPGIVPQNLLHNTIIQILRNLSLVTNSQSSIPSIYDDLPFNHLITKVSQSPSGSQSKNMYMKQEDLVGVYGHPMSGEFNITIVNDTTLYLHYGRFGQAWLHQRESPSNLIYDVVWDSDLEQLFLADDSFVPPMMMDFREPLMAYLGVEGYTVGYTKDKTLDTLPVQPWDPETCL